MPSPTAILVSTSPTQLFEAKPQGSKRAFIIFGRQDDDARLVAISFGSADFTAANAAFWIGPGERFLITPDQGAWDLVCRGVFARIATGDSIQVNVQFG